MPDSVDEISWNSFYNTGYYNDENNWLNGVLYIGNHLIDAKKDISGKYNIRPGTKSVNDSAFSGCTGLTSITIPDSVISIGDWAFSGCTALESAILPKDITYIGQEMFCDCVSLKSINIPSAVKYIGYEAFYNCTNLTDITVQNNIEEIVQFAFKNTGYYNDQSNWENNVLYMANHLLEADKKISGDYIVKPGTKTISGAAFAYCDNLKSVTIPSSVYKIGSAFVGNSLEKFIIDESNEHYSSAGNCIVEIKSKYLIAGCKTRLYLMTKV